VYSLDDATQSTAGGVGDSSEMKPQDLWEPSQKGRFCDWPQRQRATAGLLVGISNSAPRESMSLNGPSMTSGPLGRSRMVTSGMDAFAEADCWILVVCRRSFDVGGINPGQRPGLQRYSVVILAEFLP
jgi:hypothetical protein